MADRGHQTTPFTSQLTDFDDALIKRGICSREQCLLAKGMSEDQVLDTLVKEEVEIQTRAAEDTLRASLLDRELNPERVREEIAANATAQQLDELEEDDDFCDDAFLAKYREQRISELKHKQKSKVHGEVLEIQRDQWTREINAASSLSWVFVHLYEDHVKDCVVLNRVLAEIARKHAQVKFVKIRAKTAVPDWPDNNLPAAYLYKNGEMRTQLVGSREIAKGPPPFTALSVERKLVELGVLAAADVEEDVSDEEREESHRRSTYSRDDGAAWDAS
jgi:hypothetical protein